MRLQTCALVLPLLQQPICKVPMVVKLVQHAEVAQCVALHVASLGSLVIGGPPRYPGYVQYSQASVHRDLDNNPKVHHLKVVDPEHEEEIIAYVKWEVYTHGRPDLEKLSQPIEQSDKEVDQFGLLREAAHGYFSRRNGEIGKRPHLLLALLVTASEHRRKGAGSLLVKWGIEMSEETGLISYLQASKQGRRLYAHYGFNAIDTVEFNLSKYGLEGVERMIEMVRSSSDDAKVEANSHI